MAYTFFEDRFMNPYEDEETRRKREEEERKRMGETEIGSTTEKTYMDGSRTITQTREVPAQQVSGPVAPRQNVMEYTQRMESGNRPNIGYHYPPNAQGVRTSTAYGPYGITQPQYQEIQKQFPQFRNVPIEQANQQDVGRASFDVYARQLQQLGVEPNDRNLAAAHLIGAGGLRQYLQTGQLNPQQAQQFGGMQGFEKAVQGRLAMGQAPASGANIRPRQQGEQQPEPQPQQGILGLLGPSVGASAEGTEGEQVAQQRMMDYTNRFQQNQDNVTNLVALKDDQTAPLSVRNLASERAYELMSTELNKRKAQEESQKIIASGDTKKMADILASDPKDQEGSWLKLAFLGFVSPQAAALEAAKLGLVPNKYESAIINNTDGTTKAVQVKIRADGKVVGGVDMQGNNLSSDDLSRAISQTTGKNVTTGAEAYRDSTTGKIYYRQNDQRGNIFFTEPGGARYGGDTSKLQRVTDVSALQRIDYQTTNDLFKKHQGNISEVAKEYGIKLGRPLTGEEFQQVVAMVGPGVSRPSGVTQPTTPAMQQPAQPAQAQPAQAQPSAVMPQRPATTVAPTTTGVGVSTQPLPTLGSLERAGTIATAAQKQFVEKTVPNVAEDANNARQVAGTRREQLDIIRTNPSILDIYNGSGSSYDQARNVITKIVTGVYNADNQDQLFKDIKNISIQPNERAALEQFANLNMSVNPKTLRANAGPGAVSNAEQLANQKANIQNIAELTPLAALQGIYRSKFMSELADAKEAFLSKNQDTLKTDGDFNRAWAQEQNKWFKAHEAIAQARAEYLKPFNPGPSASKQELNMFRDKVFKAFELYPSPTFDTTSGWSYGTKNAEREIVKKWQQTGILKK